MNTKLKKIILAILILLIITIFTYYQNENKTINHNRIDYGSYDMIDGGFHFNFKIYKDNNKILCASTYKNGKIVVDTLCISKYSMNNKSGLKFEYLNNKYNGEYFFIPNNSDSCYLVNSSNRVFYISHKLK